ncbi:uncharacterized protein LOC123691853 isoform X2 [Colias croceus]|uniref:uncharacterized protein LOC123691853 isoform X2 n=1 Tax=Colias crocea TaxID=72248 RepID=UPI001E27DF1E|nr:uncharacterized protein LOC123691853 isoform X2 [Colias croceus]
MPASSVDLYLMHDAKNNFDAIRPAPVYCSESNYFMGPCRNVHISTNCYYGYHDPSKRSDNENENTDTEMLDVTNKTMQTTKSSLNLIENNARKRSADDSISPATKRLRQEVMVPTTSNFNPCLLRPTHNNPDISRCLMVHMI